MPQNFENGKIENLNERVNNIKKPFEDFWFSVPIPLCSVDSSFNFMGIGGNFEEVLEYKENEIIGKNLELIFSKKEELERIKNKISQGKGIKKEEITIISKNGREMLDEASVSIQKGDKGEITGYIFSFLDITEKKRAEIELQNKVQDLQRFAKELKSSRAALLNILEDIEEARGMAEIERDKTLAIVENFLDGLIFFNQDNRISSVNPKAQEFFSITAEELIGKKYEELKEISSIAPLAEILQEEIKKVFKKELKLKEDLVLEISSVVIRGKEKKIGTVVILHDITREKVVERLKTEFVSIAAHQLRTPLAAIKWTLRMIIDGDIGAISEEQKEFLEKTYESNERMIRLINDLLNITRIEEGRFIFKNEPKDIIEIAEKTLISSKELAKIKGVNFEIQKPKESIPKVLVDEEKISLVFQNLADNAVHYTNSGGEIKVSIDFLKDKNEVLVSVKDSGIGIPKEQQVRVFSRFFRGTNAVSAETEGTGLGLYIAKNIVDSHGGKIWFESEVGKGTTFFFSLPVSSPRS